MTRLRTPIVTKVEWGGTTYDVSEDVLSCSVLHGSGSGNPERSTLLSANGYILLQGERYEPNNPRAVGDIVTLTNRSPMEITQGGRTLWEGWIEQPRVTPRGLFPISRYKLSGKAPVSREVDYTHTRLGLPAAADWQSILGQVPVFGGPTPTEQFGPYTYKGRAALYLSNLAQVLGRLVGENMTGAVVMSPYAHNIPENEVGAIESDDLRIADARTVADTNQIRNRIIIPYTVTDRVSVNQGVEDIITQTGGATATARPSQSYTGRLDIPPPPMGTLYSAYEVEILSAFGTAVAERINNRVSGYQEIDITDFLTASVTVDDDVATVLISSSLRNATIDWTREDITRTTVDRDVDTGESTRLSRSFGPFKSRSMAISQRNAFNPTCSDGSPTDVQRTLLTSEGDLVGSGTFTNESERLGPYTSESAARAAANAFTPSCDSGSASSIDRDVEQGASTTEGSGVFTNQTRRLGPYTSEAAARAAGAAFVPTCPFGAPTGVTRTPSSTTTTETVPDPDAGTAGSWESSVGNNTEALAQTDADNYVITACDNPTSVVRTYVSRQREGTPILGEWDGTTPHTTEAAAQAEADAYQIAISPIGEPTSVRRRALQREVRVGTGIVTTVTRRGSVWHSEQQDAQAEANAYTIPGSCFAVTNVSRTTEGRIRQVDTGRITSHSWESSILYDTVDEAEVAAFAYTPPCITEGTPAHIQRFVNTELVEVTTGGVTETVRKYRLFIIWECPVFDEINEYRSIVTYGCEGGATANRWFARVNWFQRTTFRLYYGTVSWICGATQEVTTTRYFVTVAWRCESAQTTDSYYAVITWKCQTQERETLYTGVVSWSCGVSESESIVVTTRTTEEESHMPVLWAQNDPDQVDEWRDINIRYRVTWVAVHEGGVAAEYEESWDMSGTAGSTVNVPEGPMEFSTQLPTPDAGTVIKDLKVELLDVIGRVPAERSDTPASDPVQEIALHQYFGISVVLGVDFRAHVRVVNDVFDNRGSISYVYNERRTGQTQGLRGTFSSGQISNSNTADQDDVDNFIVSDGLPAVKARWKVSYRIVTDTRRKGPNRSWNIQGVSGTDRANAPRWPTSGRTFTIPAIPQPATPRTRLENERVEIASATITFPRAINQHATRTWTDAPGGPLGPGQVRFQDIDISPFVTIVSQERADGQWTVTLDAPTLADLSQGLTYRVQVLRSNGAGGGGTFTTGRQSNVLRFRPRDRTWPNVFTSGFGAGFAESASIVFSTVWDEITVPVATRRFNDPASQVAWGIREVQYPTWLNTDSLDANEEQVLRQLKHLSLARTYHNVVLPLWQDNDADNAKVGAYDVGKFYDVDLNDAVAKVSIEDLCVVSKRKLTYGALERPKVHLELMSVGGVKGDVVVIAPGVPRNVRAVPSDTSIQLSWVAPNTGGRPTGYHAEWREDNTGAYSTVTTPNLSYTIRNLSANTLYGYRVRARNSAGNSTYVTGTVRTLAMPLALPGPIRNLAAAADARNQLTVTWDAPNTGGMVGTYSLRYRRMGTTSWATTITDLTARTRAITGLSDATAIEVEVQAVNSTGGGAWARVTQTTQAAPAALPIPSGLNIGSDFGSLAQLAWDAVTPPEDVTLTQYRTRHKAVSDQHWTEGTTITTARFVSGLQTGSNYEFQVRAEYSSGNSDYSASFTWTAGSASTDPMADSAKLLYLDGKPLFLGDKPITLEDSGS